MTSLNLILGLFFIVAASFYIWLHTPKGKKWVKELDD